MSKLFGARSPGKSGKDWPSSVGNGESDPGGFKSGGRLRPRFLAVVVLVSVFGLSVLFYDSQIRLNEARTTIASESVGEGQYLAAVQPARSGTRGNADATAAVHSTDGASAPAARRVTLVPNEGRTSPHQRLPLTDTPATLDTDHGKSLVLPSRSVAMAPPAVSRPASPQASGLPDLPADPMPAPAGHALTVDSSGSPTPGTAISSGPLALGLATSLSQTGPPLLPVPAVTTLMAPPTALPPLSLAASSAALATTPNIATESPVPGAAIPSSTPSVVTTAVASGATPTSVIAAVPSDTPTPVDSPMPTASVTTATPATTGLPTAETPTPPATTAAVTAVPTPSATPLPPTPTSTPTATAVAATSGLADKVSQVVAGLEAGRIITTTVSPGSGQVMADVSFDLRASAVGARLYTKLIGSGQKYERLVAGNRVWQRWGSGGWVAAAAAGDAVIEIQQYLPQPSPSAAVQILPTAPIAILTWHDLISNTDIVLTVDSTNGIPRQMRRIGSVTGAVLIVDYKEWNQPPNIKLPAP